MIYVHTQGVQDKNVPPSKPELLAQMLNYIKVKFSFNNGISNNSSFID